MKLTGIASADRDRLGRQLGDARPLTSSSSTTRLTAEAEHADGEEARRLEAGVAVAGASKVQCRFQQKLLVTATQKARDRGGDVVDAERPVERARRRPG